MTTCNPRDLPPLISLQDPHKPGARGVLRPGPTQRPGFSRPSMPSMQARAAAAAWAISSSEPPR